jgi:hypothetical protein
MYSLIIRPPINAHGTWQQLASRVYFYIHTHVQLPTYYHYGHAHNPLTPRKNLDEPICPCASHACRSPGTALNQRARDARCPISVPCRYATARAQCWHCMAWHEVANTGPQRERSRQFCSDGWVLLLTLPLRKETGRDRAGRGRKTVPPPTRPPWG